MAFRFNPARDCVYMKPFIACYARQNGEQVGSFPFISSCLLDGGAYDLSSFIRCT